MDTSQNMKRKWTQYYDTKPVYVFVFALYQLMPDSIRDKKEELFHCYNTDCHHLVFHQQVASNGIKYM